MTDDVVQKDIEDKINKLNAGCLPARLIEKPIEVKTIGVKVGS